jgi:hypothetical protein
MAGEVDTVLEAIKNVQSILDDGQENVDGGTHLQLCTATKEAFQQAEALRETVAGMVQPPSTQMRTALEVVEQVKNGPVEYEELGRVLTGESTVIPKHLAMQAIRLLVLHHGNAYWQEAIENSIVGGLIGLARADTQGTTNINVRSLDVLQCLSEVGDHAFNTKLAKVGCMLAVSHILAKDGQDVGVAENALDLLTDLVAQHEENKTMAAAFGFLPMLASYLTGEHLVPLRMSAARALHALIEDSKLNCFVVSTGIGVVKMLVELLKPNVATKPVLDALMQLATHGGPSIHKKICDVHGAIPLLAEIVTNTRPSYEDKAQALLLIARMCPSEVGYAAQLNAHRMVKVTIGLLKVRDHLDYVQTAAAMALGSYAMHAGYQHTVPYPDPFPHVAAFRGQLTRAIAPLIDLADGTPNDARTTACLRALANFAAVDKGFRDEMARLNCAFVLTTKLAEATGEDPSAKNKRSYATHALTNMVTGCMESDYTKRRRCALADIAAESV